MKRRRIMIAKEVNPFSIDHIVVNVDRYYQKDQSFINKVNKLGLPYEPKKGKGTKGFKASNIWIGNQYFEFIYVKNSDGGGWVKEWVNRYNSGHRGVIGLFLKTEDINITMNQFEQFGMTNPERISFSFLFNLIKVSSKWQNTYLPFLTSNPFQIGFQQIDNPKIEKRFRKRMKPNSEGNGLTAIRTVKYYGPFVSEEFDRLRSMFICTEDSNGHLIVPLLDNQAIHFYTSDVIRTEVELTSSNRFIQKLDIENVSITSSSLF